MVLWYSSGLTSQRLGFKSQHRWEKFIIFKTFFCQLPFGKKKSIRKIVYCFIVAPTAIGAAPAGQYNYEIEWKISDKHLSVGDSGISPEVPIPSSDVSINMDDKVLRFD